jgi:gluconate 2-dehydrogenase gamma chain
LAAIDRHCRGQFGGRSFHELTEADQDAILAGLEKGNVELQDGKTFFKQNLKDVQHGFFADPIYGGNRDMVSWRMIGYPGARYDYVVAIERGP